ncbi:protein-lysine N-methyltransferase EEF2KMT [Parasteatoda tepidariorum]|uniref:protein-lysine N-methyltransferase EEF2KMT n=1 Tax=Parasteatoda tepidariorum TaxID=114398 RepID=UPI00077FD610|nr:protein-lysine N-methyltransferase EEF2KMT isoform X1 [Parasteatoda tepidariorum]
MSDAINFIEKLYLSVYNDRKMIKKHLENELLAPLCISVQEQILKATILNPICIKYPPPHSFRKMFLRILIDTVEYQKEEFSEKLLNEYTETLSISQDDEKNISYNSYIINPNCVITLHENTCFVAKSTTGLQTWEASKYLAEWCINNPSLFTDKKILELGSGIGLLGITILKLCQPKQYIFTDKSWEVLNVLSSNIQINELDLKCDIQQIPLVWSTTTENDAKKLSSDILLGADLVYDTSMVESLVHALKIFLSKESTCAYIASKIRDPNTDKKFLRHLDLVDLKYEVLENHKKSMFVYNPASSFVLYKINCN